MNEIKLLELLNSLQERLEKSGVQRTIGLYKSMGTDCAYYKKSLDLFERRDLDDLLKLISDISSHLSETGLLRHE